MRFLAVEDEIKIFPFVRKALQTEVFPVDVCQDGDGAHSDTIQIASGPSIPTMFIVHLSPYAPGILST